MVATEAARGLRTRTEYRIEETTELYSCAEVVLAV